VLSHGGASLLVDFALVLAGAAVGPRLKSKALVLGELESAACYVSVLERQRAAESSRERQRAAESGREQQRAAESSRERQRVAESVAMDGMPCWRSRPARMAAPQRQLKRRMCRHTSLTFID
jgi:hypothetical protein